MTIELQTYANNALLAKAAFARFNEYSKDNAGKALTETAGFSEAEATDFLSRYEVKYSYYDATNSLLSYTVFEDRDTKDLKLSVRGQDFDKQKMN